MSTVSLPEEFRPVADFPGYRVTRFGRVQSCWSFNGSMADSWHDLKPRPNPDAYLFVALYRNRRPHDFAVHKLVLEAFVGPAPGGQECRHLNNDRGDNRLENICWGDRFEQAEDKNIHGTRPRGTDYCSAKMTEETVAEMRQIHCDQGIGHKRLSRMFGISRSQCQSILVGRKWKHAPGPIRAPHHQ